MSAKCNTLIVGESGCKRYCKSVIITFYRFLVSPMCFLTIHFIDKVDHEKSLNHTGGWLGSLKGGLGFELGAMAHSKGSGSDNPHSCPCRSIPQIFPGMTTPVLKIYLMVGCSKSIIKFNCLLEIRDKSFCCHQLTKAIAVSPPHT